MNLKNVIFDDKWENVISQIPDESFDLGYTDPPYGMNYCSTIPGHKLWNKKGESNSKFEKPIMGDEGDLDWARFSEEMYRVLKPNTFLFIHGNMEDVIIKHSHNFLDAGFKYKGTIAWNKKFAIGGDVQGGAMKRDWEPLLYFAKGKPKLRPIQVVRNNQLVERKRISEISDWVFMVTKDEKIGFPTQKPIALAKQVISLTTDPHQIVFDPFAGSGTFPTAALAENRYFCCIEADVEAVQKIKMRIKNYLNP
jgi:site-specific DNA-methyltransferase (adenine-specific)